MIDIPIIINSFTDSLHLMFSAIILLVGIAIILYDRHVKDNYLKIMAMVIDVKTKDEFKYPLFEYMMPDGTERQSVSSMGYGGSVPKKLRKGSEVEILVNPNGSKNDKVFPSGGKILLIVGLVITCIGSVVFIRAIPNITFNPYVIMFTLFFLFIIFLKILKVKSKFNELKDKHKNSQEYGLKTTSFENEYGVKEEQNYGVKENESYGIKNEYNQDNTSDNLMEYDSAGNLISGSNKKSSNKAGFILVLLSFLIIGLGVFLFSERYEQIEKGISARGKVVALDKDYEGSSSAIVSFKDKNGKRVRFKDTVSSKPPMYDVGEEVDVIYKEDNSREAIIDRGIYNYLASLVLGGFGLLLLLIGLVKSRNSNA